MSFPLPNLHIKKPRESKPKAEIGFERKVYTFLRTFS